LLDAPDDFVARNDRNRRIGQVAIDDVQIRSTDAAGEHSDQDLPRARSREIAISRFHLAGARPCQHHRAHAVLVLRLQQGLRHGNRERVLASFQPGKKRNSSRRFPQ
jgi:hypothetical protein